MSDDQVPNMREIEARLREASNRINTRSYPDYWGGFKRGILIGLSAGVAIFLVGVFASSLPGVDVPWDRWPWAIGIGVISGAIAGATRAFRPPNAPSSGD